MFNIDTHQNFHYNKNYLYQIIKQMIDKDDLRFETFCKLIIKQSSTISSVLYINNNDSYGFNTYDKQWCNNGVIDFEILSSTISNKFKGDALEIFSSFFFQWFETNIIFGIKRNSYNMINDNEDLGVDGIGTLGSNNELCTVQVKFRTKPIDRPFNYPTFAKMFTAGEFNYKVNVTRNIKQRMIFITNINIGSVDDWRGKTSQFNKIKSDQVILIGKNEICNQVNGNLNFWTTFINCFV